MVSPIIEKFAKEYPDIDFYKVDVDEAEEVAAKCGIRADRTRDRDVWPEKWPKLTLRVVMNSCNFPVSIRSGGQMRNFKMKISPVRRPPDGPRAYVNAHSGHQTFVLNTIWPMAFSILKGQLVR